MTSAAEINLAGRVIKILNELDSWCGETHIQETVYVAKIVRKVPYESKFILYKHGPYSFELSAVLNYMRGQNILRAEQQGSYGSSFKLNDGLWNAFHRASGRRFDEFDEDIRSVCFAFAKKNVSELERIATAIYVQQNFPNLDRKAQTTKLNEIKPHIDLRHAELAFSEADVFYQ